MLPMLNPSVLFRMKFMIAYVCYHLIEMFIIISYELVPIILTHKADSVLSQYVLTWGMYLMIVMQT